MKSKTKTQTSKPPNDPYWRVVQEQYYNILWLYKQFPGQQLVMLFNIQEQRGYAYDCREFAADLSERSQVSLARQYEAACREGQMVVFIRDNARRKLVSYSLPIE
jgi:hypothetical protein